jgi:putative ABC transport system permease protein
VAVVGNRIANELYKQPIQLNRQISINGNNFRVVGILQSSGLIGQGDSTIFIPRDVARKVLDTSLTSNQLSSITVQTTDSANPIDVASQIEKNLLLSRHKTEDTKDFTVSSAQSLQEQISSVMSTITLFLGGIAAISLLVGGIGIANTMFMSVIERTRQIGVLKSLGATKGEIMKLFLTESALLGLIGGIIGVLLGVVLSELISTLGGSFGMFGGARTQGQGIQTVVSPELFFLGIAFSVLIGAVSGLLPARRASNLQPVEALRYE